MRRDPKSTPTPATGHEHEPEAPPLASLLVQQGIITDEEYAAAVRRCEQSGHSIWTALRSTSLVLPHRDRPRGGVGRRDESARAPGPRPEDDPSGASPGPFEALDHFTSIPSLVSDLFEDTVRWGATDIHFDPTPGGVRVRVRIDGLLLDIGSLPEGVARQVRSRIKVLAGMDPVEKREPQDGHLVFQAEDGQRDFRIGTLLTGLGERMVVRFHLVADRGQSLDSLGMDEDQVAAVRRLLERPQGLILIAGPIGSGKTTTLYACLQALAAPTRSLITIEDPIEYRLDGVSQVEVRPHLGLSFARGLRAILRQDPDVIMVGEIRDRDTARIASRAAATGALVLSSVHAADGSGVLRTLANYRVSPQRIGECLAGVIVQRLLRTLCTSCKRPIDPDRVPRDVLAGWGLGDAEGRRATLFEPTGCPHCLWTGYRGRTGVFEVIELDEWRWKRSDPGLEPVPWSRALATGRPGELLRATARKVVQGTTTIEEVRRILPTRHHTPGEPPTPAGLPEPRSS